MSVSLQWQKHTLRALCSLRSTEPTKNAMFRLGQPRDDEEAEGGLNWCGAEGEQRERARGGVGVTRLQVRSASWPPLSSKLCPSFTAFNT